MVGVGVGVEVEVVVEVVVGVGVEVVVGVMVGVEVVVGVVVGVEVGVMNPRRLALGEAADILLADLKHGVDVVDEDVPPEVEQQVRTEMLKIAMSLRRQAEEQG